MLVRFWGTRGSLPTPLNAVAVREKIRRALKASVGQDLSTANALNNSWTKNWNLPSRGLLAGIHPVWKSTVAASSIFSATWAAEAGNSAIAVMAQKYPHKDNVFNIFQSHPHWDHIMGFPFFVPAYIPGNKVIIYGCHDYLEEAYRRQHAEPGFPPVPWAALAADIRVRGAGAGQGIRC